MQKSMRRASRAAAGTTKITRLSDFNVVIPKDMEIVNVQVISSTSIITNYAKKKK